MFLLLIIYSCSPPSLDKESQRIVKEEIESRRVVKATDADILAKAQELGNKISQVSQEALSLELMNALKEKGLIEAIKYCNVNAIPIVDSLGNHYNAKISRTSLKTRNKTNDPTSMEVEILEAYLYSHNNNQTIGENVQMLTDNEVLYTKPIMIGNALCLSCHGTPQKDIQSENHEILTNLYPNDGATGYEMGDFRGMWSIRFNKSGILKNMYQ